MQRKRREVMPPEQRKVLEKIGFSWELKSKTKARTVSVSDRWMRRYNELKAFYDTHGHSRLQRTVETRDLYQWTSIQRSNKKRGTFLNDKQIQMLNAIEFPWEGLSAESKENGIDGDCNDTENGAPSEDPETCRKDSFTMVTNSTQDSEQVDV